MTQLARTTPAAMSTPRPTRDDGGIALTTFDDMIAMGDKLVRTGFLPDHVKTGAQAAAIIATGRELGMPPMRALRSLAIVKGKVIEYADSQLARFKADGGHSKFVTLDEKTAKLWLRHPNGDEHTEEFSLADAQKAGLLSSGMYGKFAKAMLRSRAITAGLKSLGWEGAVGAYDPDEIPEAREKFTPPAEVPSARPSPRRETQHTADGEVIDEASEPPPRAPDDVLEWIRTAPREPASESDETPLLASVAAWVKEHQAKYSKADVAAFRKAYTTRVESGE